MKWKTDVKGLSNQFINKEGRLGEFEKGYEKMTNQKLQVLSNFESKRLEEMLRTSQKNVAQQVVSILINWFNNKTQGVLPEIENIMQAHGLGTTSMKQVNIRKGLKTSEGRRKTFTNKFSGTRDHFMKAKTSNMGEDDDNEIDKFDHVRTTKIVSF